MPFITCKESKTLENSTDPWATSAELEMEELDKDWD